jgi:hypothetical protein
VLQNLKRGGITSFDTPSPNFIVRNTIEDFNCEDVSSLLTRVEHVIYLKRGDSGIQSTVLDDHVICNCVVVNDAT